MSDATSYNGGAWNTNIGSDVADSEEVEQKRELPSPRLMQRTGRRLTPDPTEICRRFMPITFPCRLERCLAFGEPEMVLIFWGPNLVAAQGES